MMPPITSGQNGSPQENIEAMENTATMASPTASAGGVEERPRPISDSAADTSSPSAGSSSHPST